MGTAEIAERLGVSRVRVHQIATTDPSFPEPLDEIKAGKVWLAEDIERWITEHRAAKQ
ncbi:DNA-binding protein [Candidatus Protofrankia californiensis]|uniref:DNA-binding protein n=1 Tax=Candidatus Protofrankia californiensis TaxID=1839754 RepID=UPI00104119D6|nr:DNA-binding protein [Candidatus Protofrankia californiensis]